MNRCCYNRSWLGPALLAALLLLSTGCKAPWSGDWKMTDMFRLDKGMPWHDDGPEKGVPVRLVGTWTDTVLNQAGRRPQRGFGGRLIFYGKKNNTPILVNGQLVVYAFDESNRDPTDNRPTRRYVFPPEQLELRMSDSELGPSYNFWLPWDEVGGAQTEVSLIARFEPKGGAVVVGEQTRHLLPGPLLPNTMLARNTPPKLPDGIPMRPAIQPPSYSGVSGGAASGTAHQAALAVYESPIAPGATLSVSGSSGSVTLPQQHERRMTTTSISLPENFRLRGGAPSPRAASPSNDPQPTRQQIQPSAPAMPAAAVGSPSQGAGATDYLPPSAIGGGDAVARMPYVPSPAVTPLSQPAAVPNIGRSANLQPLSSQAVPAQQQMSAATEVTTTVSYLSPADSARWGLGPQPSTGYPPATPPVPATPAFQ